MSSLDDTRGTLATRIACLIEHLKERRSLLVLDNMEAILSRRETAGQYNDGYQEYGTLFRQWSLIFTRVACC